MEEDVAQEAEFNNVVRALDQVREDDSEEFSFSKINAEESEEEEGEEKQGGTKETNECPKKAVHKVC